MKLLNRAFSEKAKVYDIYGKSNLIVKNSRNKVRRHILQYLNENDKILELNGGTGEDAVFFAKKGYKIHVIDIAEGMLNKINQKIQLNSLESVLSYEKQSFHNLKALNKNKYDLIFSNFGGLNCSHDLRSVFDQLPLVLKARGYVTFVVMPPICPWEILNVFWNLKTGLRRIPSIFGIPIKSNVSGTTINTYYYSYNTIAKLFKSKFNIIDKESISLFSPPSFMDIFPIRHPKLYKNLLKADNRLLKYFPFYKYGDFIIITAQLK